MIQNKKNSIKKHKPLIKQNDKNSPFKISTTKNSQSSNNSSKKLNPKNAKTTTKRSIINNRLNKIANSNTETIYKKLKSSEKGLSPNQIKKSKAKYGSNIIVYDKDNSLLKRLREAFINPFTLILIVLAIVSTFTDIILTSIEDRSYATVTIITIMVLVSGSLRFIQETRSGNAAERLLEMIETTANIERKDGGKKEIPIDEIVVGDIVHLSTGDMVPADIRILEAKDLFISQSALTGESETIEKIAKIEENKNPPLEKNNLAFMGTNVISGYGKGIVVAVGSETFFGEIAHTLKRTPTITSFEKGVNDISWMLIKMMLVMVPIVFILNGVTKSSWISALLFAISIAVGLTPEMLPMIVTTGLAKGSVAMSKKKVIIKNLNSIQNLGSMNILCTDKTGTLTEDKISLQLHLNIEGNEDTTVLKYAYLNSYYQTGLKNLIDKAIIDKTIELQHTDKNIGYSINNYTKIDEVPFDFSRRRLSIVVKDEKNNIEMITKGAVEEMLSISSHVKQNGKLLKLTEDKKRLVMKKVRELNNSGMRVLAVSKKKNTSHIGDFSVNDEKNMILIGYLAFLDPPKESSKKAIQTLKDHGVQIKVLTGDNETVTKSVCKQVGIDFKDVYTGADVEKMSDKELTKVAIKSHIFAKLSPTQKSRIVNLLRESGNVVGYMGDGINDAIALEHADVGISVDNAVDIAKESADVILLEKDLMVLENGVLEGRKTYTNISKYIKLTASSNFGNVFSVLIASALLPFLPMMSLHLILLNLIYDISCIAIPWDNVDEETIRGPKKWNADSILKFTLWIGPTSSIFDILTFVLMYFVISPMFTGGLLFHQLTDINMQLIYIGVFQAGWFIESMWSQTLVIHMIRTAKIPFIQSNASLNLTLLTFLGIIIATAIPFTSVGNMIGLHTLPAIYFLYLAGIIVGYMILVSIFKKIYIHKYNEFL